MGPGLRQARAGQAPVLESASLSYLHLARSLRMLLLGGLYFPDLCAYGLQRMYLTVCTLKLAFLALQWSSKVGVLDEAFCTCCQAMYIV